MIIPSYNSELTIEKCLDSILSQSFSGDYEIILVDSSNDNTPQIVSAAYDRVKLFHLEEKTDPGRARNIGIKNAGGSVIAFIDSDCVAARDWLERIWNGHKSFYNVIGGSVMNGNDEDNLVAWAGYISEFREFAPEQPKREVTHIPTCNISYKKAIFEQYGMFQGAYYPQEDLLFNYNLSLQGEKILFDPAIQVHHHHRTKIGDFLTHQEKIGKITAQVLKEIELEGSFIPRHPVLSVFLLPFLPLVKFVRTVRVFLLLQSGIILKRPLVLTVFMIGLFYWTAGFARGLYAPSGSRTSRVTNDAK